MLPNWLICFANPDKPVTFMLPISFKSDAICDRPLMPDTEFFKLFKLVASLSICLDALFALADISICKLSSVSGIKSPPFSKKMAAQPTCASPICAFGYKFAAKSGDRFCPITAYNHFNSIPSAIASAIFFAS